ncbi:hypothetical protein Poly51_48750 [Rubripirellula tenax]|uniref:Knr4/Smi1-like domain-containing protein n=1 Tax=Rubripirellula tenax TaxID=2528015 RepID=A0A5C6EMV5_9BACT|nr:SMI1/KNR4 family protein [Rubripirellula tenax]TWU48971.1 hypothetical protein Poly51_48750 [Rubripirellula tenax]
MSFVDRLAKQWNLTDVSPDALVTADAIASFENRFALTLPNDVRAFYERFNGLLDMDNDLNRFWPIGELDTVPAIVEPYSGTPDYGGISSRLPHAERYFAFADHSIWVHVYAIRLAEHPDSNTSIVWIADGNTFDILADTFAGFWEMYLTSLDRVLVP